MKQLRYLVTLKKCHFCKTNIDLKVSHKEGLLEFKCVCGKAHGFTDEKDLKGNPTIKLLEENEDK